MRRRTYAKIGVVCALAMAALPFCDVTAQAKNEPQAVVMSTVKTETITTVEVKSKTYKKEYKTENGKIYKTVKYVRPVLTGDSEAIKKINAFYEKKQKAWVKASKEDLEDAKFIVENNDVDGYYSDEYGYKVKYNKNGYISILGSGYAYSMGAHGSPYCESHTFDLNTGKELKVKNIMSGTDKQIKSRIVSVFEKKIKKDKDMFFSDALDTVKKSAGVKNKNFYLTNSGIVFYYSQYEIAPYAAGVITGKIPYKTTKYFKIDLR